MFYFFKSILIRMYYYLLIIILLISIYFYFKYRNNLTIKKASVYILISPEIYSLYNNYINSLINKFKNYSIDCEIFKLNKYDSNFFTNDNNIHYLIFHSLDNINLPSNNKYEVIKNIYIINTEDLSNKMELSRVSKYLENGFKIIDYNIANIRLLDKNFTLNNIYYIPYQVNTNEIYNNNRHKKDICIIDPYSTSHRKSIYMTAYSTNEMNINIINSYDSNKDLKIINHKILINTHLNSNFTAFESVICDRFIFNKVLILSEHSNSKSIPEDLKKYIVEFYDTEDLKNKLEIISKNPENYYNTFWNDFNLKLINENREKYFNYLVKEFNIFKNDLTMEPLNLNIKEHNAYVINIDKRKDRWELIQNVFKKSSIHLTRISAIKKNDGHLGCGLSYMKIVKYAKENNLKTVLIFEDDNMPLDNFSKRWIMIKEWLDNNLDKWEIYNGGARYIDWQDYNKKMPNPDKYDVQLMYKINSDEYLFQSKLIVAGNWVYINSNCYDKVLKWLDIQTNIKYLIPMDQYINSKKYFNCLYSLPQLALQYNSKSDTSFYESNLDEYDSAILNLSNQLYKKYVYNS